MDFNPYELYIYTILHTKIFLFKYGKFQKILTLEGQWHLCNIWKVLFRFQKTDAREIWKNTNVVGFKTAENCQDAQNLPYVTVSKALIGQIFPRNGFLPKNVWIFPKFSSFPLFQSELIILANLAFCSYIYIYTDISTRVEIGKTRNCVETRRPQGGVFSHNFEFFQFSRVLI